MPGLGTIVNGILIIIGGLIGLSFGRVFSSRFQETLLSACGLATFFIGTGGVLSQMLVLSDGKLATGGSIMMISSLIIGSIIGEGINIEKHLTNFGEWLKAKSGSHGDAGFVNGFVSASLVVSIGAMAVLGPINEALYGDHSVLYAKATLDLIFVLLLTLTKGKGCLFSFIPVVIIQGTITILAGVIKPLMTPEAISALTFVGSILIAAIGINMVWDKHIRVSNMFPSVVVAVVWAFIEGSLA